MGDVWDVRGDVWRVESDVRDDGISLPSSPPPSPPPPPPQSSLCSVDLDQHSVDVPDDLPELPNKERLIRQISEKVQEYFVNCPDIRELPSSPKTTPSKVSLPHSALVHYYILLLLPLLLLLLLLPPSSSPSQGYSGGSNTTLEGGHQSAGNRPEEANQPDLRGAEEQPSLAQPPQNGRQGRDGSHGGW